MQTAIIANHISKVYKNISLVSSPVEVFRDFDLQIEKGSFAVLYGPNGCGKSTLIHVLADIIGHDSGTISILGDNPSNINIGIVFQNYSSSLFPWLNVLDNIYFGMGKDRISKSKKMKIAKDFLNSVGLSELSSLLQAYPYMLSGGQQQMVAIARALFPEPPILFLDEAFTSLSAKNKNLIIMNIQEFCKKRGITCIFAIHDLDDAIILADDLFILKADPMRIKGTIRVDLDRSRDPSISKSRKFLELRKKVLDLVYED